MLFSVIRFVVLYTMHYNTSQPTRVKKFDKRLLPLLIPLVHAGVLKYGQKLGADFHLQLLFRLRSRQGAAVLRQQLVDPCRMLVQLVGAVFPKLLRNRSLSGQNPANHRQLPLQAARQHRKPHHFNQAYVLFLDMVKILMRMEDSVRVCLGSPVVAQHQIHLIFAVRVIPGNRRYRIMRRPAGPFFRIGRDFRLVVAVLSPFVQNAGGQLEQRILLVAGNADDRHRPFHYGNFQIREILVAEAAL